MILSELSPTELNNLLNKDGLVLSTPPFSTRIKSKSQRVGNNLHQMYGEFEVLEEKYPDFDIAVQHQRTWYKAQAQFFFDDYPPFLPLPAEQDFAMFEWGLNWCYANHANEYLILHGAVIARDNQAVILPGFPGAGKSTLTCELMFNNWQLLSDELTLINSQSDLIPAPRAVSLKNESIDIIRQRHPEAVITTSAKDTAKGTVAHVKPSLRSVQKAHETCRPKAVVFPKYQAKHTLSSQSIDPAEALVTLAEQGFNYHILGQEGFQRLVTTIEQCQCFYLTYSELDEAINWFEQLFEGTE